MADAQGRAPRWMRNALVISLALNLAVAGLVLGAVLKHRPWETRRDDRDIVRTRFERPPPELRELGPVPFIVALSPEDREAILRAARDRSGDLQASREALRGQFEEMLTLLRADTFDAAAMSDLLTKLRAAGTARQSVGEALLVARFEAMSAEERAAYADRLDRSLMRGPPRR